MRELPHLVCLQAFEAAARHLSFTRAAAELNCTQAAISQRVRALEQYFGRPLFHRHANGLDLSSAGKAYLPGVTQALDMAEAATRGLTGRRLHQSLTVSGPISFLNLWLAPRLAGFVSSHAGVAVQLNSSIWTDPNLELADVSIAIVDAAQRPAEAIVLGRERLVLVGSAADAAHLRAGGSLDALPQIEVLGRYALWDIWAEAAGQTRAPQMPTLRADNASTALALAAGGAGVTVVYSTYAAPLLASGRLLPLAGPGVATPHVLTLARNPARKTGSAARDFIDWMLAEFAGSGAGPAVE